MKYSRKIELTDTAKEALVQGMKYGDTHQFRRRCQGILLKSEGKTNKLIGEILGCTSISVHLWLKAYNEGGINAIKTKSVQRRKPILNKEEHERVVREAVKKNRQSIEKAKEEVEKEIKKKLSISTLKRFLGVLAQDISV